MRICTDKVVDQMKIIKWKAHDQGMIVYILFD